MTTVHTPQNPDGASVISIEALMDVAEKINSLASDAQNFTFFAQGSVDRTLFRGTTAEILTNIPAAREFYHFSADEKRTLEFIVSELDCRIKALVELSDDFVEEFNTFRRSLKGGAA
ncbi:MULTISPECIES: hypothetical protein [Rhizobium/Agrobacterium group]|uniref:Uncharacterized protein n=2 Tax=Rhizobium/Agrobacterium group TaxID=227290 RepID=B9JSC9_ALLAM|nr:MULTISPECIES: hypothetical protein [Rhizobium/Agrobacterium group]ACM35622.1 hypothetical protein Avi_0883 [Allorhizobium ampelinum S4]MUO29438.1 hypothetical protein [Agrobacterium vitis]MUO42613.1 hypothetical protein [Agrobacterium vitis]MUP10582.1 hypothetical protein [Agrobacterium vitis]